jgi:hypothetical protein
MIVVKPYKGFNIDKVFDKYVRLLKQLTSVTYNNKYLYCKYILIEAARVYAEINEMIFDKEFDENNIQYNLTNNFVKDRIDLIVDGETKFIIQTLIDVPNNSTNDSINHLLGESLKLSFENDNKYIFWICNDLVYQTYFNNYGNNYIFKTVELVNSRNFTIATKFPKDNFQIIIINALNIDNHKNILAIQIL